MTKQLEAFETIYKESGRFDFHITKDKLTRFLRDRRLNKALEYLKKKFDVTEMKDWSVLVVCGGVGGEGIFFLNHGFANVTVSDFSNNSLSVAMTLDHRLKTMLIDAENISLANSSYDLVIVQDGLHHLPRPALGFTEMLRVARKAIIVIEPYDSFVGKHIGTEWEEHEGAINYVYRWDKNAVTQTVKSYLLKKYDSIKVIRLWDHNVVIRKLITFLPEALKLQGARLVYKVLSIFNFCGNMMVGIVCK